MKHYHFIREWRTGVLALLLALVLSACVGTTTSRIDERGIIHLTPQEVIGNIQAYHQVHIEGGRISFQPFKQAKMLIYQSGSATNTVILHVMLFRFKPEGQDDTHSILAFLSESTPLWYRNSLAHEGFIQNWKTEGQFVKLLRATYTNGSAQSPTIVLKVSLFD